MHGLTIDLVDFINENPKVSSKINYFNTFKDHYRNLYNIKHGINEEMQLPQKGIPFPQLAFPTQPMQPPLPSFPTQPMQPPLPQATQPMQPPLPSFPTQQNNTLESQGIRYYTEEDFLDQTPNVRFIPNQGHSRGVYNEDLEENEPFFSRNAKSIYNPRSNATHPFKEKISLNHPLHLLNVLEKNEGYENTGEILDNLFNEEPNYFVGDIFNGGAVSQSLINADMFYIVVDWLLALNQKLKNTSMTLILACSIIKEYMAKTKEQILRSKFQLVCVVCFLIACKQQEVYIPRIKELVYYCDGAFSASEMLEMEMKILNVLEFDINVVSSWDFAIYLCKYLSVKVNIISREYINYGIYLCVKFQHASFIHEYQPSKLAASILYIVMLLTNKTELYDDISVEWTRYPLSEISDLVIRLFDFLKSENSKTPDPHVYTVFSTAKYSNVSGKTKTAINRIVENNINIIN